MEDTKPIFPRDVIMEHAGIGYWENGPNMVFLNIVIDGDELKIVAAVDQTPLGNNFSTMATGGTIVYTKTLMEIMQMVADAVNSLNQRPAQE